MPNGVFTCIHSTTETGWVAGDPTTPNAGEVLAYVVTAVSPDGEETQSGDPQRMLSRFGSSYVYFMATCSDSLVLWIEREEIAL